MVNTIFFLLVAACNIFGNDAFSPSFIPRPATALFGQPPDGKAEKLEPDGIAETLRNIQLQLNGLATKEQLNGTKKELKEELAKLTTKVDKADYKLAKLIIEADDAGKKLSNIDLRTGHIIENEIVSKQGAERKEISHPRHLVDLLDPGAEENAKDTYVKAITDRLFRDNTKRLLNTIAGMKIPYKVESDDDPYMRNAIDARAAFYLGGEEDAVDWNLKKKKEWSWERAAYHILSKKKKELEELKKRKKKKLEELEKKKRKELEELKAKVELEESKKQAKLERETSQEDEKVEEDEELERETSQEDEEAEEAEELKREMSEADVGIRVVREFLEVLSAGSSKKDHLMRDPFYETSEDDETSKPTLLHHENDDDRIAETNSTAAKKKKKEFDANAALAEFKSKNYLLASLMFADEALEDYNYRGADRWYVKEIDIDGYKRDMYSGQITLIEVKSSEAGKEKADKQLLFRGHLLDEFADLIWKKDTNKGFPLTLASHVFDVSNNQNTKRPLDVKSSDGKIIFKRASPVFQVRKYGGYALEGS